MNFNGDKIDRRIVIVGVLAVIVLSLCAALALDWSHRPNGAQYLQLVVFGLGVLCPSPLSHKPTTPTQLVDASSADNVDVSADGDSTKPGE